MSKDPAVPSDTIALNTKLEEEFVSPLTAIRGALEILRDVPDLAPADHARFVEQALQECGRLEQGVRDLATTVYAAARRTGQTSAAQSHVSEYSDRIVLDPDQNIFEVDFSGHQFTSASDVNAFYDAIEATIAQSGHKWFFLINTTDISIWPEAWVAFAHRGKKINVNFSLGTARFAVRAEDERSGEADLLASREAGLEAIAGMKSGA